MPASHRRVEDDQVKASIIMAIKSTTDRDAGDHLVQVGQDDTDAEAQRFHFPPTSQAV